MVENNIEKLASEFIKSLMLKSSTTQSELARRTGIPQDKISRMVRMESRIGFSDFVTIGMALDPIETANYVSSLSKKINIMSITGRQISIGGDRFVPASALARPLLYPQLYASHPVLPPPSVIPDLSEIESGRNRESDRYLSGLCIIVGDGTPITLARNAPEIVKHFWMECQLGEARGSQGLDGPVLRTLQAGA